MKFLKIALYLLGMAVGVLALPSSFSCHELNRFLCKTIDSCGWNFEQHLCTDREGISVNYLFIDNFSNRILSDGKNNNSPTVVLSSSGSNNNTSSNNNNST